ncbi:MAG: Crp/Fnr family transcriptional regulator [Candidatus Nitrospinota bacterium M3_3B_026]
MIEALRKTRLFSGLTDDMLDWLSKKTVWTEYKKGEHIFYEGEDAEKMYIIAQGRVKVVKEFPNGKNAIIGIFGPGGIVAEVAAIDGGPYPASSVALEDCRVGALPAQALHGLLVRDPEASINMIVGLGAKLRELTENLGSLAVQTVEKRLARFLTKMGSQIGVETDEGLMLMLPMTRRDLAEIIGTSFEVVERSLKKMREEKIISVEGKKIVIKDQERLAEKFED